MLDQQATHQLGMEQVQRAFVADAQAHQVAMVALMAGQQAEELDTYYPASPLVCLTWTFEGSAEWLSSPGFMPPTPGFAVWPLTLSGPVSGPTHLRAVSRGEQVFWPYRLSP
jgi:hypothetical protein